MDIIYISESEISKGFLINLHKSFLVVSWEVSNIYRVLMFVKGFLGKAAGSLREVPGVAD